MTLAPDPVREKKNILTDRLLVSLKINAPVLLAAGFANNAKGPAPGHLKPEQGLGLTDVKAAGLYILSEFG